VNEYISKLIVVSLDCGYDELVCGILEEVVKMKEKDENYIAVKELQRILKLTEKVIEIAEKYRTIWDDVQTYEQYNKAYEFEVKFVTRTMVKYLNELECYSLAQREFADKFFVVTWNSDYHSDWVDINYECHLTFDEILAIIQEHIECFGDSLDYEEREEEFELDD
jgi:hypothetical protein